MPNAGMLRLAQQYAAEAIRLRPGYAQAHYNLGIALGLQGKIAEAAAEYAAAVELQPDYAEAHYNLGGASFLLGQFPQAAQHLSEAVRLQPANAAARSKLAFMLARQGNVGGAILQYQTALRLQPDLLEALKNLAWILATNPNEQFRNGAQAARLAEQAVRLTREKDAGAWDALGAAYAESGDFTQALSATEQALAAAAASGQAGLRDQIEARRKLYRASLSWRE